MRLCKRRARSPQQTPREPPRHPLMRSASNGAALASVADAGSDEGAVPDDATSEGASNTAAHSESTGTADTAALSRAERRLNQSSPRSLRALMVSHALRSRASRRRCRKQTRASFPAFYWTRASQFQPCCSAGGIHRNRLRTAMAFRRWGLSANALANAGVTCGCLIARPAAAHARWPGAPCIDHRDR